MVFQPNYSFKKAQRQRAKQSRKDREATDATETQDGPAPEPAPPRRDAEAALAADSAGGDC